MEKHRIFRLANVHKVFPMGRSEHTVALADIDLEIFQGEFFIFVGPSGCGKSTLLRILCNLDQPSRGTVTLESNLTPFDMSFVFQQFALLPWLTVSQNIALPLVARGTPSAEQETLITQELKVMGLEKFAHAYPRELSGGMRQRVGIARALVTNPKVIFMDEPFSELDSFTAAELRKELLHIWQERKLTIVMVTHIVEEAVELADRIAVLTPRPAKVERIVPDYLPRPRIERSEPFYHLEDLITEIVKP